VKDKDSLDLVVWGSTLAQHDYDFQHGGADSLIRMLRLEFQNPPQKQIRFAASSLGEKGSIKTFGDLVNAIQ
jgi:hypothetical protein